MQYVDLFTWLRGDILVKADKMTMANSLELRVPFLDTEVFAIGSSIPTEPEDHQGDHQVRAAPGAGRHRPGARPQPAEARLPGADPALARGRHVRLGARDHHRVAGRRVHRHATPRCALLDAHRDGPHDYSRKIWTLLVFLIWHGIFVEGRIHPEIPEPTYPVRL